MEKHNLENFVVSLHDQRSRLLWCSNDPLNALEGNGLTMFEITPDYEHDQIRRAITECFINGESAWYIVDAGRPPKSKYRVTMLPVSSPALPGVAGVAFGSKLPDNYLDITQDDRVLLKMLADDLSHKEIATAMHRSESSIDSRIKNLKVKLGCKGIGGLVGTALQLFII